MLRKTLRLLLLLPVLLLPALTYVVAYAAEPAPQVIYFWPSGHPTLQGADEREITNPPNPQLGQVVRQFKNIHSNCTFTATAATRAASSRATESLSALGISAFRNGWRIWEC